MKGKKRTSSRKPPRPRSRLHASKNRAQAPSRIRIIVADHLPMDRAGMVAVLRTQADFEVVAEPSTTEEAIFSTRKLNPSIVILALRLPGLGGRTALASLRSHVPRAPILAVAERGEGQCLVLNPPRSRVAREDPHEHCATGTDCLQLAVAEGAAGTIRRSAEPEDLFKAIRTVASGNAWYEAGTATAIMRHALARTGTNARPSLSERETEVAELIANGRSNKEIAQALGISEPTVKKHVGHILGKLKLQDRLQIGLYVARNPLVLGLSEAGRQ